MDDIPRLNKQVITIISLNDSEEEKQSWFSRGPQERIEAIELNRRMVYGQDRVASRLQRFLETAELVRHKDPEDLEHLP
jgi:hypothetical protein